MATTQLLAAGTSTAYSSDVTCVYGTPVTFGAFVAGNANASKALPEGVSIILEREASPGGQFIDTGFRLQNFVNQIGSGPNVVVNADGVFRWYRISGQTGGVAVGVNQG
jgi:hypothetical protein